jgi:hypothetical protein
MKWSKERDDLIAQTKAFVQSVSGRKPQVAPEPVSVRPVSVTPVSVKPVSVKPVPVENPFAELGSKPAPNAPIENFVSVEPVAKVEKASDLPPVPAQSDIRSEIQTRIAAFQAHQHRFHREREAYFNSVLTKARSAFENDPDAPTS